MARYEKIVLEIGSKYGDWTVLELDSQLSKFQRTQYKCICKCGTIKTIEAYALRNMHTHRCRRCSCIKKEERRKLLYTINEVGEKYNGWEVVEHAGYVTYKGRKHSMYIIKHKCGEVRTPKDFGNVKQVGLRCWKCKPGKDK